MWKQEYVGLQITKIEHQGSFGFKEVKNKSVPLDDLAHNGPKSSSTRLHKFANENLSQWKSCFKRDDPFRISIIHSTKKDQNSFEQTLPKMVHKSIANYKAKYQNFVPGGTSQHGAEQPSKDSVEFLNPLKLPLFKLAEMSLNSTSAYTLAKLRDRKIFDAVRVYLAFLNDNPLAITPDGMSKSHCQTIIAIEGLPTQPTKLRAIYNDFKKQFGATEDEIEKDLLALRSFLNSQHISHLQKDKDTHKIN